MSQTYASNDFDDIMSSLVLFMRNQNEFKDMDFDGSAIRELLRVLAYNAQQQAFQNNFVYNELQLDTAQLRPNVTSIASRLGYTPSSMSAARIKVNITVVPSDVSTAPSSMVLSRDTQFYATKDGQTYILSPNEEYTASLAGGVYSFNGVTLLQGIWTINAFSVQTQYGTESYTIPNDGVDTNFLEVAVRTSETSGDQQIYNQFKTAYDLGSSAQIFFLRENRDGLFEFKFGDNSFAKRLDYGNVITARYLVTKGADGNSLTGISPAASIGGYYDITIDNVDEKTYGGADKEDIDSIRTLAPISFAASGNAVTPGDYVGLTKKLFPEASDAISWGGEDNVPPRYGYTFVSVIPKNSDNLSSDQKATLVDILKQYNVGSITPIIVDPVYTFVNVNTNVKYKASALTVSTTALITKIKDYCSLFSKEKMERFGGSLDMSRFSEFLNNIDVCIKGNSTTISYEKRFNPNLASASSYIFDFGHKIAEGSVVVSSFTVTDTDSSGYTFSMKDSGGVLSLIKSNNTKTVVINDQAGTVDYEKGLVSINNFLPNTLTDIYAKVTCSSLVTDDQSLIGVRNAILKINDVNVNLLVVDK